MPCITNAAPNAGISGASTCRLEGRVRAGLAHSNIAYEPSLPYQVLIHSIDNRNAVGDLIDRGPYADVVRYCEFCHDDKLPILPADAATDALNFLDAFRCRQFNFNGVSRCGLPDNQRY